MGRVTVGLEEWIALAASHEVRAIRPSAAGGVDDDPSSGAVEGGAAKDAWLTYTKQALRASLLVLGSLRSAGAPPALSSDESPRGVAFRPDDVILENFTVDMDVESLSVVEVHDSLQLGAAGNDQSLSDAHLKNIGLLLHSIFCRGESPPLPLDPKSGGDKEEDSQGHSISASRKRADRTDRNPHERLIARGGLPPSICWLVLDLLRSGEVGSNNPPFESIEDIILELKQILERPEVYLRSSGDSFYINQERPDFGERVLFGRTEELQTLIREAVRASVENDNDTVTNNLVLISGDAGSGKSRLVESIQEPLSDRGFVQICAKFDQMAQQQPLSTIANAFDDFFHGIELTRQNNAVDRNMEDIITSIERNLPVSEIMVLVNLMPSIRNLFPNIPILRRVVSDPDLSAFSEEQGVVPRESGRVDIIPDDYDASAAHAESSRNRLHFLFRTLVQSMSSPEHPVLLFLDDLQWADQCSLKLISSLLLDSDHLDLGGDDADVSQYFIAIGSYRPNEVDESHALSPHLEHFDASPTVEVTKINLRGLTREITNEMLSHMLRLPLRLTSRLTDVFMAKTLGNPFHIREFAMSLWEEKILHFSLSEQRWIWDIEAAWALSVDESIAELLARKLLQLPEHVQLGLKVVSCFGSYMDKSMLPLLLPEFNIEDGLHWAVKESILGNRGACYKFSHDMLQETSYYHLMDGEERSKFHYTIGLKLISNLPPSDSSNFCPMAFTAIGHINRAKASEASEDFRLRFAEMNLNAGQQSLRKSDFECALSYLEHGIAFLPEAHWASHYRLSISLFENAALACFSLAQTIKLRIYLDKVFANADCLDDKLKGYYLLMRQLSTSKGSLDDASEKLFYILEQLGEKFPSHITPDLVRNEISSLQTLMKDIKKEDILTARRMTDKRKIWTVKFLALFILYLFFSCPQYLPLVAMRIIKISASSGYSEESAFGFIAFGIVLNKFGDIENAYWFGKLALSLLDSLNAEASCTAKVYFWYCLVFACWKEPTQATIDSLRTNTNICLRAGEIEFAGLSLFARCRLSFFAGQDLSQLARECAFSVSLMTRLQQMGTLIQAGLLHCAVRKISGVDQVQLAGPDFFGGIPINNEEELVRYAMNNGKQSIGTAKLYLHQMLLAFWFKRYEEVCEISMKHGIDQMGMAVVMHVFFEGLAAFRLARKYSEEPKWIKVGEKAISSFQRWLQCGSSKWNFESRLLLLEAEKCFTKNDKENAEEKYNAAIKSARLRGFTNEEGLAFDFCSAFHRANGNAVEANRSVANARACYEKWGAFALVNLLDDIDDSH